MVPQRTLARTVRIAGIGLHTGAPVNLEFRPAQSSSGIVFCRTDLPGSAPIPARIEFVSDTRLRTTLACGEASVSTVEHLLAALAGLGIDNAAVALDGPEVPAMDGSAAPFVALLSDAGIHEQPAPRRWLRVSEEVTASLGDTQATLRPADTLRVDFTIDYGRWPGEHARVAFDAARQSFAELIAPARTFGFQREIAQMQAAGLVRGGSLDNAVVIDGECVLNPEGLRFADELARHKILDAIGDLYLLGAPLQGELRAHKSGHTLNVALLRALLQRPDSWEYTQHPAPARYCP